MEVIENRMKKIIVETPDDLHREFKAKLAQEGRTIKEFILTIITLYLNQEKNDEAKTD